jgi:hypothetical protein
LPAPARAAVSFHAFAELQIGGMRLHEIFRRERPVFSLVAEDVIAPRGLHNANRFLEDLAVDAILFVVTLCKVRSSGPGAWDGSVILKPARLVTARETDGQAPLEDMVERCDLLRYPHRIVCRQHIAKRVRPKALRV